MKNHLFNYSCIFLILLTLDHLYGQQIQWANHAGSQAPDYGGSSITDDEFNSYYCGIFKGVECYFKTDTLYQYGYNGLFVVKYDNLGREVWLRQFGDNFNEISQDITDMAYFSNSQKIYCVGRIYSSAQGNRNFVSKLDLNGKITWLKTFSGVSQRSLFTAVTIDDSENLYVTGSISTLVMFDTIPVPPGGFIAKFDSGGHCFWAKNKIGYNNISISDVDIRGLKVLDNMIFISGYKAYEGDIHIDTLTISHNGYGSSMVMCFDSSCNIRWVTEGISKMTYSYSDIGIDEASNIYYTGCFRDTISFSGNLLVTWPGLKDLFIVKLDKDGKVKWLGQTRSSVADGYDCISDKKGNSYITGFFKGIGTFGQDTVHSVSGMDAFLAKYDSAGSCKGVIHFANGHGSGLSLDNNGNPGFLIVFEFFTTVGQTYFESYGSDDLIFVKCEDFTGVEEMNQGSESKLLIYANPNTGRCSIVIPEEFAREDHLVLRIFDTQGRLVRQSDIDLLTGRISLNIEALAKGVYTTTLGNGTRTYTGKIVFN